MIQYIDKFALVAEIEKRIKEREEEEKKGWAYSRVKIVECEHILSFIDTLEVKEVDLIIHTIIAECCDWLAMNTNLSHDEIEDCRNLMLTVKEEQQIRDKLRNGGN